MKSKITKIQILKKGLAIALSAMFLVTPMAYATTSLDDSYLDSSILNQILYGKIGSTVKEIEEWFAKGHTTLYILNETQLRAFAEYVNNGNSCSEKEIILLNDIELDSNNEWIPIGNSDLAVFKGTFNGNNYTISGLRFNRGDKIHSELEYVGLFGKVSNAIIKNVTLDDSEIIIEADINKDTMNINGETQAHFKYINNVGGIAGIISDGTTISNCTVGSKVYITGTETTGGIIGTAVNNENQNKNIVTNCINRAKVKAYRDLGGIIGGCRHGSYVEVKSCINEGYISGYYAVGGIVGGVDGSNYLKIESCINRGEIIGSDDVIKDFKDQIASMAGQSSAWYGGGIVGCCIIGSSQQGYIQNCTNSGKIYGFTVRTGGIVGALVGIDSTPTTVKNCLNTGTVEGARENNEPINYDISISNYIGYNVNGNDNLSGVIGSGCGELSLGNTNSIEETLYYSPNLKVKYDFEDKHYYKAGDTISVTATYNKKLYTALGTSNTLINKDTAPKLTMKINETSIEFDTGDPVINGDMTKVRYTKIVTDDMINGQIKSLYLKNTATYYAIEGSIPTDASTYSNYKISSISKTSDLSNNNLIVDTVEPTINTKVYVENVLETGRYTAGKEILFEVTTSEIIDGMYELPQIQVSFSESGVGKYNYLEEGKAGIAKCKDAKINIDGTTTWKFSYIVQERDEGELEFTFTAGEITDLAGNVTNIKDLYTPSTITPSQPITGTEWSNDLGVTFKFYKNSVLPANEVTSQTYFTNTDDLIVVATYDKVLYVHYGLSDGKNTNVRLNNTYKDRAPSLYLNGDSVLKQSSIDRVTTTDYVEATSTSGTTTVRYKFTDIAKNYGLQNLTQITKVVLKNENNGDNVSVNGTSAATNGLIPYAEKWYNEYNTDDEGKYNKTTLTSGKVKTTSGLDDIIIDPIGVSTKIEKADIYADTTAPTVEITANKENPTNADSIIYTFKFNEKVEGFTGDDITVNNGIKATKEETVGEETITVVALETVTEGLEYTLEVKPTIPVGNEGILQVIVEEGACKDLVAINNVRQENNITIDKVKPTFTSYEVKQETGKIIIEATFSEELSDASGLVPTLTVGGKASRGSWEDVEIYDNNKVRYVYNISGADGGKVEVSLAGTVKDKAGNDSETLNIAIENDITIEQTVIKNGKDTYSFKKGNAPINDFTNPTYFVKNNTITVIKDTETVVEVDGKEQVKIVTTNYTYTIPEDIELNLTHMKYMNLVEPVEGETTGTVRFSETRKSGSIDISEANIYFDTTAPKVTTQITANNPTQNNVYTIGEEFTIKATTSEAIQEEFTTPEINVKFGKKAGQFNNGKAEYIESVQNENGTTTWVYRYRVSEGDEGAVSLEYASGSIKDLAGNTINNIANLNQEENIFILNDIVVDTIAPTIEIIANKENPTNADLIKYTFKFSEKVEGFTAEDITVNNGEKAVKEITEGEETRTVVDLITVEEGKEYTLEVEPTIQVGNAGDIQVIVEQNSVQDLVGHGNVRQEKVITVDKKAPTVEIVADKNYVNSEEEITYTFNWAEAVKDFTKEDITVNNGNKGEFVKVNDSSYTLKVTPTNGNDVEVIIENNKCTDIAGNNNIGNKNIIAVIPTLTITTNTNNPTNVNEIIYTFTWSEEVVGFTTDDITVNNKASKGSLTSSGNTYTMTVNYNDVIPDGNEGEVNISVPANAVQDKNGNGNAETVNTTKIDRIAPIFIGLEGYVENPIIKVDSSVDSVKEYYKEGETVTIVATFSEAIKGTAPTLALQFSESGNAKGTITPGTIEANKITYTYTIVDGDEGTLSVKGFSGILKDKAENEVKVTKRALDGDTIIADTKAPELMNITAIAPDFEYNELLTNDEETKRYGVQSKTRTENTITIIAEYSENVYSLNSNIVNQIINNPVLRLKFGTGTVRTATFEKIEGSKIYYKYNIQSGDNGDLSIVSLDGTVSDKAGNTLTTNTVLPTLSKYEANVADENRVDEIIADTTRLSITFNSSAINYDDNGNQITGNGNYYRKGSVITVTATTNEYVYKKGNENKELSAFVIENAPTLNISFATSGTGVGTCTNVEYSNNKTIFTYTYAIKDNDNGTLTYNIPELSGYDIALNGNYVKTDTKSSIIADTVNPVTNWQSWVESEGYGLVDNLDGTWVVTFSERLYEYDPLTHQVKSSLSTSKAPILLITNDNTTALETNVSNITTNDEGKTVITYTYANYTRNMGAYGMKFANVTDKAGNIFNYKDITAPILSNIKVTNPDTGTYKAGEVITIVATFNEKLDETSTAPTLVLQFSKSGDAKGTVTSGVISENTITYTYTITAHDNKGNGDNGVLSIKSFTGTGLKDLYDNEWVAPESVSLSGNRITADTISPVITKVEAKNGDNLIGKYVSNPEEYVAGRTNTDTIEYVVTYSENITLINEDAIEMTNGKITNITVNNTDKTQLIITVKTTTEGVQSLIIPENVVEDIAGNTNEFFRFNGITVDFTKPTVRFISEYNGGAYVLPTSVGKIEIRPNVEINEDISKIEYKWNNDEYAVIDKYSSTSDIVVPTKEFTEAGEYTLSIRVTDIAGNTTVASKEYSVKDSEINITSSNEEPTNQDVMITVEFEEGLTDNRKVAFKPEGSNEYKGINPEENGYRITENGTVYAEATDKVGNKVFIEKVVNNIDKVAPEVELSINGGNLVIGTGKDRATVKTTVKTNEPTTIKYAWEGYGDGVSWGFDWQNSINNIDELELVITPELGTNICYLNIIAIDAAGNETQIKSLAFNIKDSNSRVSPDGSSVTLVEAENTIQFERHQQYVDVIFGNNLSENRNIELTKEEDGYVYDNYVEVLKSTTITATAEDVCGNKVIKEYKVENVEGPEFEIFGNPTKWTNKDVTLEISCYDELSALTITKEEDGATAVDILQNMSYTVQANGKFKVEATDIYGNKSEKTIEVTKIDKELPVISDVKNEGKVITITAEDTLSGTKEYAISTTTELPVEWSESNVIKTTEDGTFYVWAKDNAGNVTIKSEAIVIDTTAPIVAFSYSLSTVIVGTPIETTITTNEDAKISYSWDNETWVDSEEFITSLKVSKETRTTGSYTLYAKATDKSGNTSKVQTIKFTVIENPDNIKVPEIIFEDLPTIQVDGVKYVKVSADMTAENITGKMNKEALCEATPEYTKLTDDKDIKTGSEITIDGKTKFVIVVNGDTNCDGKVGPIDVTTANSIRLNKVKANIIQQLAADFDLDGIVKPIDITMINSYRLGKIKGI